MGRWSLVRHLSVRASFVIRHSRFVHLHRLNSSKLGTAGSITGTDRFTSSGEVFHELAANRPRLRP
jgi:hypothetical protein